MARFAYKLLDLSGVEARLEIIMPISDWQALQKTLEMEGQGQPWPRIQPLLHAIRHLIAHAHQEFKDEKKE